MNRGRNASHYTRRMVLFGLVPLLFLDLFVGLPEGVFLGGGALVMLAAAVLHASDGERRAGAGWLAFGAALVLVVVSDPLQSQGSLIVFALLLVGGLFSLVSQQWADAPAEGD